MKYYTPECLGYSKQSALDIVSRGELQDIMRREFPHKVTISMVTHMLLDMRVWLTETLGKSPQSTMLDLDTFTPFAMSVDTDARWCYTTMHDFRFKTLEDAVLFKLMWGGR